MSLNYTNPVWPGYFADPFVLRFGDYYFAYGTGEIQSDGRAFPILRSPDLVDWEWVGGALTPFWDSGTPIACWAPEVMERDGKFYLYYSANAGPGDEGHRLRVATADLPQGPFVDSGKLLLPKEGFTIDASPFRDPLNGKYYLFFAKDFLDGDRPGTALAAVELADDMVSTVGPIVPILRPSADWQIFQRNRTMYEQHFDAWHTVEGPFIVAKEDKYYCLYSGGCWENDTYGVGFAVSDSALGPFVEPELRPSVLEGVRGKIFGPGHNSVVFGPDNQTLFIIYHAWDAAYTKRQLCIDPLDWTPNGPHCRPTGWESNLA